MSPTLHIIRTHYPHWGQYSGINQFIQHINPNGFTVREQIVSLGVDATPVKNRFIRAAIRWFLRRKGMRVYNLNDGLAEAGALRQWWYRGVDLIHYLDGEHSLQFLPLWFPRLRNLRPAPPIVATFHQPPDKLATMINIEIVKRVDHVVVLTPEQVDFFRQYLPPEKISLILHGIHTTHFCPAPSKRGGQKFKCLSVGSWLRDYETVFDTAKRLQHQPDIEFHIVSRTASPPPELNNIRLYTGIPDEQLLALYQEADVLFLPMLAATANNAILEGIACGLPIVSTALPSVQTYLPGKEAVLLPKNNPEDFADILIELKDNIQERLRMAQYARNRALELSWPRIASSYEDLYRELLTRGKGIQRMRL